MNIVMILAGGEGTRMGAEVPKQFIEVLGRPVLFYTAEIFQENTLIDGIEIVCHSNWIRYCREMAERYGLSKVQAIVEGGQTFQESVLKGIEYLKNQIGSSVSLDDKILIQYGASPFTSQKIINAVIDMTKEKGVAVTGTPCYQLMGSRDSATESKRWIDRDKYIQIACPYGFRFSYLLDLYERAEKQGLLDIVEPHTTSLVYALGDTLNIAYGNQTNIKITTMEDIDLLEGWILLREKRRLISL